MKLLSRINKTKLVKGLNTLSGIWKRRLVPVDLEKHYMLYWFLACGGNILETARRLKIHRNTIQGYFLRFKYSKKAVRLRHAWRQMKARFPRRNETDLFNRFYHRFGLKPYFSIHENQGLIALWSAGFPMKVLKSHYLLWASRSDKSRAWIETRLEFSNRHQLRIYGQIGRPGTRENYWLKPLDPKRDEWYLPRYHKTARKHTIQ